MILSVCSDPDVLSVMNIINNVIYILKVLVPIIIVITSIISFSKAVMYEEDKAIKGAAHLLFVKIIVGAMIFFIPTFMGAIINLAAPNSDYVSCFNNATKENIKAAYLKVANSALALAEKSANISDYSLAASAISRVEEGQNRENLEKRLELVKETIDKENKENIRKWEEEQAEAIAAQKKLSVTGTYSTGGTGVAQPGVAQTSEPDPSAAVNYWKNILNPNNFIYPRDSATGLPLGAWPKNYGSIPTQLSSYKLRNGFIWPCTPVKNNYHFVYQHNGMDIMAVFGTPIYSPVEGTLEYSEWGHTGNKGGDETAYSASIKLSTPITFKGKTITNVFLTHMSGIRYRCARGKCNRIVKKGELLGFVGNAAGSAESIGWAPHLHITLYAGTYENGIYTKDMEILYGVDGTGTDIVAGG